MPTNDTERPWAAPGMTHRDRAIELCAKPDGPPRIMEIKEAIAAACKQVLAGAAPKWASIDDGLPSYHGLYAVVGEDADGEGFSFTEHCRGNIKDWLNDCWQVTHYCGPLQDSPIPVARISGEDMIAVLQARPAAPPPHAAG